LSLYELGNKEMLKKLRQLKLLISITLLPCATFLAMHWMLSFTSILFHNHDERRDYKIEKLGLNNQDLSSVDNPKKHIAFVSFGLYTRNIKPSLPSQHFSQNPTPPTPYKTHCPFTSVTRAPPLSTI